MADVFSSREGYVAVVPGQQVVPGRIKIGGFSPRAAMISGVEYDQKTNQQFQHTLDGSVYIYVFGDLMGNVTIEGRAFPLRCGNTTSGLAEVFKFYAQKRASKNSDLIQVSIGEEPISGFLTAIRVRSQSMAESPAALFQSFWLTINTLPRT
jgi:hypothetical protein